MVTIVGGHRQPLQSVYLLFGVSGDRVLIFVVNLDSEEFFNAIRRPHFNGIPRHAFTNVDADLATDTLVQTDLHIWNHDVHTIRRVAWRVFDAVDRTEGHAGLAAGAVVRNNDRDLLRLLFLSSDLGRGFRDD